MELTSSPIETILSIYDALIAPKKIIKMMRNIDEKYHKD
jgi:hypothetical protein